VNPDEQQQGGVPDPSLAQSLDTAEAQRPAVSNNDPELDALLQRASGPKKTEPQPFTKGVSKWFNYFNDKETNVEKAIGRGVMKGVDGVSNTIVGSAVAISKGTGIYKLGRDKQQEEDFASWYERSTFSEMNPFQFGEERRRRIFGADEGGVLGLVEGAAQFGVGMLAASKLLNPFGLASKAGAASEALGASAKAAKAIGGFVGTSASGLVADMSAFDPHADRLSNLVESGPSWLSNPVSRYLKNEADDNELESRLKAGMEGMVLGSTIEAITFGVKALKIRNAVKAGSLSKEAGEEALVEVSKAAEEKAATKSHVDEVVVEKDPNEDVWIPVLQKADGTRVTSPDAPRFKTPAEAENHAASVNVNLANQRLSRTQASPEFIDAWRKLSEAHQKGDDRTYQQILEDTGMNVRWDLAPDEIISQMKAAVDADPVFQHMLRNGESTSWQDAATLAGDIFPQMNSDTIIETASNIFGKTEHLDAALLGLKQMTDVMGHAVSKLNRIAQANPDNPIAFSNLAASLDSFMELEGHFAGAKSNVARGLAILRKKTGGEVEEALAQELVQRDFSDAASHDPHVNDLVEAVDEIQQAKSANAEARATKDTDAVSASEVQMQRVYDKWKRLLDSEGDGARPGFVDGNSPEGRQAAQDRAAGIKQKAGLAADEGLTTTSDVSGGASRAKSNAPQNPIMDIATLIDKAENDLTGKLAKAREDVRAKAGQNPGTKDVNPVDAFMQGKTIEGHDRGNIGDIQGPANLNSTAPGFSLKDRAPAQYRATAGLTREEILALSRQIMLSEGDPGKILLALRAPRRPLRNPVSDSAWKKFFINFRINAMLSGPKTLVTNAANNAIVAAQMPMETWWAGKRSGNPELAQQGWDTLVGLFSHYKESWQMAKKAWNVGENILDVPRTELRQDVSLSKVEDIQGVRGALGAVFQAPTRFLMATDEFFKQLNYRANLRGQILRQAREQGITDPKLLAERLTDDMHFATDVYGGGVNPIALQYSRVATFTNDLEYGIGKAVQSMAQQHPAMRFVMPFVRTPVNIFRFSMQRTPGLAMVTRQYKEALKSGDPERIALVKARQEFGAMVMASAGLFAATGSISGAGPTDPKLRRQMKDAGWQPYSVKLPGTDKWVSYRRGDPTFSLFGVMADLVQVSSEMDDTDVMAPMSAGVASVMSNVTSKTFMQGVTDFMDAMSSGRGDVVENLLTSSIASFVPNVLRQVDPNDTIMETRGLMDELMARVPGFSETLEPRRNILGEKVLRPPGYFNRTMNPFTYAPGVAKDDVLMELTKVGQRTGDGAFSLPMERMNNGEVDLTDRKLFDNGTGQSPYDRMQELLGPESEGGQFDLRGKLKDIMAQPNWKDLSDATRYQIASTVIGEFQEAAQAVVLKEYPLLAQATGQAEQYNKMKEAVGRQSAKDAVMSRYDKVFIKMK
jgi:translation elongation factor EF-1beta